MAYGRISKKQQEILDYIKSITYLFRNSKQIFGKYVRTE